MDYCEAGDLYGKINSQRGILMQEPQVINNLGLISELIMGCDNLFYYWN